MKLLRTSMMFRLAGVAVAAIAIPFGVSAQSDSAAPNIVIIMADDMGFSDIGSYGGEIRTPNLDRLAREGMRFTQFYNNAKCNTTRMSLLTGLYPRRDGDWLTERMVTIGEAMGAAGYQTALSGKWHMGSTAPHRPIDRGFDEFYGLMDGCCNFFNPTQPDPPFKGGRVRVFGHNDRIIREFPDDYYTTDAFTDHAVETIGRFSAADRPYFLHVCYTAPHYPLHAKPEDIARYEGRYMDGWQVLREERYKRQIKLGLINPEWSVPGPDERVLDWATTEDKAWQDRRMAVYAAMVDSMDQGIGRIMEAIEASGEAENTVVMFLSDNGGCAEEPGGANPEAVPGPKEFYTTCGPSWAYAQNTPFRRYKSWAHEGGIATPLIVRWPGRVEAGSMTHQVGHVIDLLPTSLAIADAEYPAQFAGNAIYPVEGRSLVPTFTGEAGESSRTLFWEWAGHRGMRSGDWKFVWDRRGGEAELFDMKSDRTETRNLATQYPETAEKMRAAWIKWAGETGLSVEPNG